jgi:DNA-binding TFAR19-related protein (PDSD5 family)
MSAEEQAQQDDQKAAAEEQRRSMLMALLHPEARDRCECIISLIVNMND